MSEKTDSWNNLTTTSTDTGSGGNLRVDVDVKVGILHTVANAIYATPVGKIREAVANALDNDATWIVILADRITKTLCIYDNGHGITVDRFKEIFKSIGYGLLSTDQKTKLSYFGLGLMSIFQLGDKIKLFTRPRREQEVLVLEVDTNAIFDPANKDKSISTLSDYISLNTADKKLSATSSPPLLDDFLEKNLGGKPQSFTEILIEEVKSEDLETICHPEFVDELRKALPLRVELNEPFLKQFTGRKGKKIKALLKSEKFCPTINVYFDVRGESSIDDTEGEIRQLWKYFPRFRSDLEFPDANLLLHNPNSL